MGCAVQKCPESSCCCIVYVCVWNSILLIPPTASVYTHGGFAGGGECFGRIAVKHYCNSRAGAHQSLRVLPVVARAGVVVVVVGEEASVVYAVGTRINRVRDHQSSARVV